MVLGMSSHDPGRLIDEVSGWIANTRKEAHRSLGDVELGVRRAVDEAAAAIAARAEPDQLPTIDVIQEYALRFLGTVGPILDVLADRMVYALGVQLAPLDRMGAEFGGVRE
ncbi:MAG: hypothetical protein ABMB14_26175, partial [Myxococcota bacterium]